MLNDIVKHIFILGSHAIFDAREVEMRSRHFTIIQYNKEKSAKFRFVFLILVDSNKNVLCIILMFTKAKISRFLTKGGGKYTFLVGRCLVSA